MSGRMSCGIGEKFSYRWKGEGERQYNEMLLQVQHQFLEYREHTTSRLEQIEQMVVFVVQKLKLDTSTSDEQFEEEFVNPFGIAEEDKSTWNDSLTHLKLRFPKYDERQWPSDWIQDYEEYFKIFKVPDNKKTLVARMHLDGVAKSWYQVISLEIITLKWKEFCTQFCAKFGMRKHELLYENFKNLRQHASIDQYCQQFESYLEQLKVDLPQLTEEYFIECFICGLQRDVQQDVKLLFLVFYLFLVLIY